MSYYSGEPGHACLRCFVASELIGPRYGFDYTLDLCGLCRDLSADDPESEEESEAASEGPCCYLCGDGTKHLELLEGSWDYAADAPRFQHVCLDCEGEHRRLRRDSHSEALPSPRFLRMDHIVDEPRDSLSSTRLSFDDEGEFPPRYSMGRPRAVTLELSPSAAAPSPAPPKKRRRKSQIMASRRAAVGA